MLVSIWSGYLTVLRLKIREWEEVRMGKESIKRELEAWYERPGPKGRVSLHMLAARQS